MFNSDTGLSKQELQLITVAEIIQELIKAHHENRDVNLTKLKCKISQKYRIESQPKLVNINTNITQSRY